MEQFTPISGTIGGILIGLSAAGYFYLHRQVCGISGMVEGCTPPFAQDLRTKLTFLVGLMASGALLRYFYPLAFDYSFDSSLILIALGGFLVGFGSRVGYGCTSGHGVCGIGRVAPRSILATLIFMITGFLTASLLR